MASCTPRLISPTLRLRISTMRGVSYSKRKLCKAPHDTMAAAGKGGREPPNAGQRLPQPRGATAPRTARRALPQPRGLYRLGLLIAGPAPASCGPPASRRACPRPKRKQRLPGGAAASAQAGFGREKGFTAALTPLGLPGISRGSAARARLCPEASRCRRAGEVQAVGHPAQDALTLVAKSGRFFFPCYSLLASLWGVFHLHTGQTWVSCYLEVWSCQSYAEPGLLSLTKNLDT